MRAIETAREVQSRPFPSSSETTAFTVTIYALPSASTEPRIRLGSVTGPVPTTFAVPRRGLQPNGSLVLLLHAIGARSSWVSPSVVVPDGGAAHLDITASPSGDLSRSSFYALTATTTSDAPGAP